MPAQKENKSKERIVEEYVKNFFNEIGWECERHDDNQEDSLYDFDVIDNNGNKIALEVTEACVRDVKEKISNLAEYKEKSLTTRNSWFVNIHGLKCTQNYLIKNIEKKVLSKLEDWGMDKFYAGELNYYPPYENKKMNKNEEYCAFVKEIEETYGNIECWIRETKNNFPSKLYLKCNNGSAYSSNPDSINKIVNNEINKNDNKKKFGKVKRTHANRELFIFVSSGDSSETKETYNQACAAICWGELNKPDINLPEEITGVWIASINPYKEGRLEVYRFTSMRWKKFGPMDNNIKF